MNDSLLESGSISVPETAEVSRIPGGKAGDLDSFKSSGGTGRPVAGKSSSSGWFKGGKKKKTGRPTKNNAGFSEEKSDEVADDPDIEAAREDFEICIVELLVATTDGLADSRFQILLQKFPEAEARGLADKARLTEKERKYFGALAIRLWRKYLGDKYLFTDEAIGLLYSFQYLTRNWEGMNQARKISAEIKNGANQQSGLQGAPGADSRSEQNGKEHPGVATRL